MSNIELTERQRRELEFYNEFSKRNEPSEVNFDVISGEEVRPWNSYWRVVEIVKQHFSSEGQRLLDFGCGAGTNSLIFAKIGYEVFGFDLSPSNISIAERLAQKYGVAERTHFSVSAAESLDYEDEFFDVIAGVDILHHVNIGESLAECARVLKPGGLAVFHEPVRAPVFDALRETRFGTWLAPKEASLNRHVTADERKLSDDDLALARRLYPDSSVEHFLLLSRLDRFIRNPESKEPSRLERIDFSLFRALPFLKRYAGIIVLVLRKR
ncbi:MAG: methyltransferase domain-containing protein [Acidobacteriota bacterium]|nr:methyltransferase domain-containing protein [Acidobacteriota bacterium]